MGKTSKRRRDEHYTHEARYVLALSEAVAAVLPRFASIDPPVLGWHHVGPFDATPEDHWIYYVLATEHDRLRAEAAGFVSRLRTETVEELALRNFPEPGRESLTVRLVSQEAIDAGGGSFAYFR